MTNANDVIKEYRDIRDELEINDTAAAILVLAQAILESATFNRANAENFGHELALALKNVLEEKTLNVGQLSVDVETNPAS